MWKMIIGQSIYQLVVTLVLNFAGMSIFNYSGDEQSGELETVIFNTFVWMQVFNQYKSVNCFSRIDLSLADFQ
jgi:Ca2+-transporting ATPase